MITLHMTISHTRFFDNQSKLAQFLGIKNSSKKSIQSRCKVLGYKVEFE